ncbi:hypothetical protein E2C01_008725 [Portunus trituberculatus]|uniref:Uncharacterized protein n=1 Tax=Portunus trituberculatus TaxID=210409 RepID=A0A5B7D2L2_PORTR|nr:hypothetical protein [Portunus trituberculatus]
MKRGRETRSLSHRQPQRAAQEHTARRQPRASPASPAVHTDTLSQCPLSINCLIHHPTTTRSHWSYTSSIFIS